MRFPSFFFTPNRFFSFLFIFILDEYRNERSLAYNFFEKKKSIKIEFKYKNRIKEMA